MKQDKTGQLPVGTRVTYANGAERSVKQAVCFAGDGTGFVHSYVHINERTHEKYGGLCKYRFRDGRKPFWAVRIVPELLFLKGSAFGTIPADQIKEDKSRFEVSDGETFWSDTLRGSVSQWLSDRVAAGEAIDATARMINGDGEGFFGLRFSGLNYEVWFPNRQTLNADLRRLRLLASLMGADLTLNDEVNR